MGRTPTSRRAVRRRRTQPPRSATDCHEDRGGRVPEVTDQALGGESQAHRGESRRQEADGADQRQTAGPLAPEQLDAGEHDEIFAEQRGLGQAPPQERQDDHEHGRQAVGEPPAHRLGQRQRHHRDPRAEAGSGAEEADRIRPHGRRHPFRHRYHRQGRRRGGAHPGQGLRRSIEDGGGGEGAESGGGQEQGEGSDQRASAAYSVGERSDEDGEERGEACDREDEAHAALGDPQVDAGEGDEAGGFALRPAHRHAGDPQQEDHPLVVGPQRNSGQEGSEDGGRAHRSAEGRRC